MDTTFSAGFGRIFRNLSDPTQNRISLRLCRWKRQIIEKFKVLTSDEIYLILLVIIEYSRAGMFKVDSLLFCFMWRCSRVFL